MDIITCLERSYDLMGHHLIFKGPFKYRRIIFWPLPDTPLLLVIKCDHLVPPPTKWSWDTCMRFTSQILDILLLISSNIYNIFRYFSLNKVPFQPHYIIRTVFGHIKKNIYTMPPPHPCDAVIKCDHLVYPSSPPCDQLWSFGYPLPFAGYLNGPL